METLKHRNEAPVEIRKTRVMMLLPRTALSPERFENGEMEVHWFHEVEYKAVVKHGGKMLHEGSTYVDNTLVFKGLNAAVDRARGMARHFGITAESSAVVELLVSVRRTPLVPNIGRPADSPFVSYRDLDAVYEENVSAGEEWLRLSFDERLERFEERLLKRIEPVEVIDRAVAWSSQDSDIQVEERRAALLEMSQKI